MRDKKIAAVLGFDWTRFYDEAEAGEQDSTDEKTAQAGGGEGVRDYD